MGNAKLRPGLQFEKGENIEKTREMTNGKGADVCVDAVGLESGRSFPEKVKATVNFEKESMKVLNVCFEAVRRSGTITIAGFMVHYWIISPFIAYLIME